MAESGTAKNDRKSTPADEPAGPPRRARRARRRLLPPPAWWPLPACAVLGLAAGGAYGVLKAPEYAATSYVVAVPDETTEPATALGFAQAYARIATSASTLAYAQPRAGIPARQLRTRVRAETSPESPMIAITGTSGKASEAADIANAVADALSLSSNQAAKNTGVQLLLFNQAVAPSEPASPSATVSAAVGLCAGGLIGGLVLLTRPGGRRRDGSVPAAEAAPAPVTGVTSLPGPAHGEAAEAAAAAAAKEKEPVR
ncbi:lipopolysaccharide biosynthesis protein [Streptomyces sp. NPDC101132]|uniref:lipopolysaccharide biosynthesis protein n=1 Tax=Streptomyces sp. NPDC101132 TaxID=3366110 RepID=UPI003816D98C